ncbi:MAG TPA: tetratricopeptide repeat protein [Streptosporangiaceae bacterium]|nr:tetratricopeptide repeat protein [Streptosporangiaceae bacterium]
MTVGATSGDEDQHPYAGLRPFRREDGRWFFARTSESTELTALWQASQVTVLCGTPGVGKTSLLQVGVLPRIGLTDADILPTGRLSRVSAFPIAALPEHNPYTLALLSSWSPGEPATRLSGLTVHDFLRERSGRTDSYGDRLPTFAAIDQAEKLFTDPARRDPYRQAFIEELAEALDGQPDLRLLLSIREDSLEDLARYQQDFRNLAIYMLGPLTATAAIEAVRLPIERAGYSFAPGVAEELVGNLRSRESASITRETNTAAADRDVEPALLQAVCAGFWAALPRQVRIIGFDQLRRYGDTTRLLADFCARAVGAVADEHGLSAADLRSWLQCTFTTDSGTRGMAYEGLAETAGLPNTVARALEDWHVIKAVRRSGLRWYELQHDCLIGAVSQANEAAGGGVGTLPQASAADHLRAAEAAMADGDLELAERQAATAVQAIEENDLRLRAEAESLLGNVEHARRHPEKAEARYRHAAALFEALQDTSAVARLLAAIGQSLLAQGRAAEAVDKLHAAIRRIPNDLTMQTELGRALWHQGQHAAAVAVLTGVLTIDGHAPNALRARGEILADLGEAEKALRDLDRVRRPRWPTVQAARALALATLRRPTAADEAIDAALTDAPDNGQVLLYAARVGALGGDRVMAANLARRAEAAENPALPPHQLEQARRLQRLGEAALDNGGSSAA